MRMKKIILLPKTDTVTLCLPEQWAGAPIICKLEPILEYNINSNEVEIETLKMLLFINKRRKTNK